MCLHMHLHSMHSSVGRPVGARARRVLTVESTVKLAGGAVVRPRSENEMRPALCVLALSVPYAQLEYDKISDH